MKKFYCEKCLIFQRKNATCKRCGHSVIREITISLQAQTQANTIKKLCNN